MRPSLRWRPIAPSKQSVNHCRKIISDEPHSQCKLPVFLASIPKPMTPNAHSIVISVNCHEVIHAGNFGASHRINRFSGADNNVFIGAFLSQPVASVKVTSEKRVYSGSNAFDVILDMTGFPAVIGSYKLQGLLERRRENNTAVDSGDG